MKEPRSTPRRLRWALAAVLAGGLVLPPGEAAAQGEGPRLFTNEDYIEEVQRDFALDIADSKAVFRFVVAGLPGRVKVYPTENYYYFWFHHGGIKYAGNLRLDIEDRDKGLVHFTYFKDFTDWQRDESDVTAVLGAADGVTVKRLGNLVYEIGFEGRTVVFELNDLSGVKPPDGAVRAGETYIGPVFDESGVSFFLVFNSELKIFHYILDETSHVPDRLFAAAAADRIRIGTRTSFAFYRDRFSDRQILVGVHARNTGVNNYLDGPFDQLPDNFLKGDTLLDAILAASPEMAGELDRYGNSPDGKTRYLIAPYMQYEDEQDLALIADCAASEKLPVYYNCFSFVGFGGDQEGVSDADQTPAGSDDSRKQK